MNSEASNLGKKLVVRSTADQACGFPSGSVVKNPPVNVGDASFMPGQEDALEKEMATHSSILAWRIPWTEEPGGLQSMGLQRGGHNWAHMKSDLDEPFKQPQQIIKNFDYSSFDFSKSVIQIFGILLYF